jgi:hypothetical protein
LCGTAAALVLGGRPTAAVAVVFISVTAIAARLARAPAAVESAFVTLLAVDAWLTSSGLMARIDRHDTAGHLILTTAVTPVLAATIGRFWPPARRSIRRTGALAGLAAVGLAVGWELLEWCSDTLLGTNMSLSPTDTMYDLISGVIGAGAGAVIAARAMAPTTGEGFGDLLGLDASATTERPSSWARLIIPATSVEASPAPSLVDEAAVDLQFVDGERVEPDQR